MGSIKYFVLATFITVWLVDNSCSYAISDNRNLENLEHKLDILLDTETHESGLLEKLVDIGQKGDFGQSLESESYKKSDHIPEQNSITSAEVLSQLTANSKRMESMVVLIVDLQSALSQAVSAQEKQMALRTEVVELREEVDSLRQEIKTLRSEEAKNDETRRNSHLSNQIHNEETTIKWLKDSFIQLRHELTEERASINITGLFHLKEELNIQADLTKSNIENLQNQMQKLVSNQAQTEEDILEIRGDISEVRTTQANFGIENVNEIEPKIQEISNFQSELHDLILKEQGHKSHSSRRHDSRNRKLNIELRALENIVEKLSIDQKYLHRNFRKLQKESSSTTKHNTQINIRNKRSSQEYGTSENYRLTTLEKSFAEHTDSLDTLDKKVNSLEQLKDSTKALFNVMEALETKYDGKITDIQNTLGRMETNANKVSLLTDDLKEEQTSVSKQLKFITKDSRDEKEQREKNYLRIASMQSQILKLGLQTCISEDENLIQKIEEKV